MPHHPGIVYTEHELMPGKPMFRCATLSATLQVSACAGMWSKAQGDVTSRCRGCPIGAAHAGAPPPDASVLHGVPVCPRCGAMGRRLIAGLHCVSCYNRSREVLLGRNAKGKRPEKHPPLEPRMVRFWSDGSTHVLRREHTVGVDELVVETLRDQPRRVVFGWGKGKSLGNQEELW